MKKALKIIIASLSVVLVLVILVSYISYNTYKPKDPVIEVDSSFVDYHETYNDCRDSFVKSFGDIDAAFDSVKTGRINVVSDIDKDLSVDWCYIPAQKTHEKLLILNSGLHGIEGFTGSAVQSMFIEKFLTNQLPDNMGVLLIHGLNPYGFKYHRKATEKNIDLNRNCMDADQMFSIDNKGFAKLGKFLMPHGPANVNNISNQFFYITAIYKIIRESMPVLRQAALQGQTEFQKGVYYGGKGYEPQIDTLKYLLIDKINKYQTVLNVDLHTGYGERGTLHLFINKPEDDAVVKGMETVFEGSKIDWGNSGDFYTITGDYTSWVSDLVPEVFNIPMVFEYGTMNTKKTFGSLKSMQIMILENQGTFFGYKNLKNEQRIKELYNELYFPSSPAWRSKVISDSYVMINRMIKNFEQYN
jgi:hypothetical protein